MNKSYRGACERAVDNAIAIGEPEIYINWISVSTKEVCSGGADRIAKKLLEAGYRPDGNGMKEEDRAAYESGEKLDGRYIRLPQETWCKKLEEETK